MQHGAGRVLEATANQVTLQIDFGQRVAPAAATLVHVVPTGYVRQNLVGIAKAGAMPHQRGPQRVVFLAVDERIATHRLSQFTPECDRHMVERIALRREALDGVVGRGEPTQTQGDSVLVDLHNRATEHIQIRVCLQQFCLGGESVRQVDVIRVGAQHPFGSDHGQAGVQGTGQTLVARPMHDDESMLSGAGVDGRLQVATDRAIDHQHEGIGTELARMHAVDGAPEQGGVITGISRHQNGGPTWKVRVVVVHDR